MKWLPIICCLAFSCPALADDAAKPMALHQPPPNVQFINGKKFFSLQNVHHFTGGTNNPKALSVMHHPRTDGTISTRHSNTLPFSSPKPPPTKQDVTYKDKVLSIFAPDDKTATPR